MSPASPPSRSLRPTPPMLGMPPIPGMLPMPVPIMQVVVELLGCFADAVGPVVEHDDPFGVVAARLFRVVDDHRQIQPVVGVQAGVRDGPSRCPDAATRIGR